MNKKADQEKIEANLAAMRRALRLAHQFEWTGQPVLAERWGQIAAGNLELAVRDQYTVLDPAVEREAL